MCEKNTSGENFFRKRIESTIKGFPEKQTKNNIGTVFKTKGEIEKEIMCMREILRGKHFRKKN